LRQESFEPTGSGGWWLGITAARGGAPRRPEGGRDPRERGNLKDRQKDVFDRLKTDWETWNDTMLPERPRPAAYSNPGNFLADHYGVINPAPAAPSGNTPTR
jgi:hypothetical protein